MTRFLHFYVSRFQFYKFSPRVSHVSHTHLTHNTLDHTDTRSRAPVCAREPLVLRRVVYRQGATMTDEGRL
jgi:hypothetical protein